METDWDKRYREGFYRPHYEAHELVRRFYPLMPNRKPVIDIAMGQGADLLFLAGQGLPVCGLDRSWEAIRLARETAGKTQTNFHAVQADAARLPFKPGKAGCVLVFYFLIREIMAELTGLLAPGGLLIYETFLKRQNSIDGPRNPEYLLDDGELLKFFPSLELLFYEEGVFAAGGKRRALARCVGKKR